MLLLQSLYNCVQMYFVIGCLEVYRSFFKTPWWILMQLFRDDEHKSATGVVL